MHDPYKTRLKLPEPTVCPACNAVFQGGRWQWAETPADANQAACQACNRIADKIPAGVVTLSGDFLAENRSEILNLARNQETLEKGAHPLHRIMKIESGANRVTINTTDIHLPRRIGEAVHRAYSGELDFQYDQGEYFLRVNWHR